MAETSEVPLKDRLLALRLSRKLRQKEMADALNVLLCTYRSWEYGKKTPKKVAMAEVMRRIEAIENNA